MHYGFEQRLPGRTGSPGCLIYLPGGPVGPASRSRPDPRQMLK